MTIREKLESVKAFAFIRRRTRAYKLCFGSPAGQEVLVDLASFCRAAAPCWDDDSRLHALTEGRREVFLRIARHLHLTNEQVFALYTGQPVNALLTGENDAA